MTTSRGMLINTLCSIFISKAPFGRRIFYEAKLIRIKVDPNYII